MNIFVFHKSHNLYMCMYCNALTLPAMDLISTPLSQVFFSNFSSKIFFQQKNFNTFFQIYFGTKFFIFFSSIFLVQIFFGPNIFGSCWWRPAHANWAGHLDYCNTYTLPAINLIIKSLSQSNIVEGWLVRAKTLPAGVSGKGGIKVYNVFRGSSIRGSLIENVETVP